MEYLSVYKCLCDRTRLRVLNLLHAGPLCVCHIGQILAMPQPKISRHLKYMKAAGVLESERHYNWTIYRLTRKPHPVLEENLKCLQDIRREEPAFAADLRRRKEVVRRIAKSADNCPPAVCVVGRG